MAKGGGGSGTDGNSDFVLSRPTFLIILFLQDGVNTLANICLFL